MPTQDNAHFHIVLVKGWVEREGRFLLAQRSNKEIQAGGAWAVPGGKVENEIENNILQMTLQKELKEEVDLEIEEDILLVHNDSFNRVDGAHVIGLTFLCQYKAGEAKPLEDTVAVRWFSLEELEAFDAAESWLKKEISQLIAYKRRKHE